MNDPLAPPVHFLLVDDRDENLVALEAVLRRKQLVMIKAHSGPEALEALLKYDVALALIDVQMPTMSGFELAELMRGTERTRRVPIIFLTAGSDDQQRRFRGYEAGAVDFLHKPIEPDILKSKADVFFELFRQRQEVSRQRDELQLMIEENTRLLEQTRAYAAALQNTDRRKDEFLATLAHELRNPLAPILNAVQVLRLGALKANDVAELHSMIERQVNHMVRLVDDLFDVSRITRGKIQLRRQMSPLAGIVENAVETSMPLIKAGDHRLTVKLPDVPLAVEGDAVRLSQVLANLLNNAAKYTPHGGQISLTAETEGEQITIRVRDNGIGIPREMLADVFEMFTQVNQHLQRSQGGLGIGLTLVKRLVEMHDGSIAVESAGENQGAEFIVRLPLANSAAAAQPGESRTAGTSKIASQERVLVIDDNADAARGLAKLLELAGHAVTVAHDSSTGIRQLQAMKPAVVFLDLGMPGTDGFETAKLMRGMPEGKDVTLVAVTGWGQAEDRSRTRESGFDLHLVKPVDIAALGQVFNKN